MEHYNARCIMIKYDMVDMRRIYNGSKLIQNMWRIKTKKGHVAHIVDWGFNLKKD
jgi:hypothetical protein